MLRLSHSQIKLFKDCPRSWFFKYVQRAPEEDVETKYSDFGKAMHETLQAYHNGHTDWQGKSVERFNHYKLADKGMSYNVMQLAVINGIQKNYTYTSTELKIFLAVGPYHFVGYLDVVDSKNHIIYDWKSSTYSADKVLEYKEQLLCYAYLYWRKFGVLPSKCVLFFNKVNRDFDFTFTLAEVQAYEADVIATGDKMMQMKATLKTAGQWPRNLSACHWCGYKNLCLKGKPVYEFRIVIQNNYCFLEGPTTPFLLEGIDRQLKFDLKDKHFIQQAALIAANYRRPRNFDDIGTVHCFDKHRKMFMLGHIKAVKGLLQQYADYNKVGLNVEIDDRRDHAVLSSKLRIMPPKLITDKVLHDYQEEAVEKFVLEGGVGYLAIGTGGGKSLVTAELIRTLDTRTLWVIDKKELLRQSRAWFQEYLGVPVGIIGDGEEDIQDVTVATIQSLHKHRAKLEPYLATVNFAIVDEGHHASARTFQEVFKLLKNTRYRLGTTATPRRDDGSEKMMFGLLGDVIYTLDTQDLIKRGILQRPRIVFHPIEHTDNHLPYHEAYEENICNNVERNQTIVRLAKHHGTRVLVLTNRIEHGQMLLDALRDEGLKAEFIHGSVGRTERIENFDEFKVAGVDVLVGTMSIFSEGIDLPELEVVINASANKGDTKTIQSLGRVLRRSDGKDSATYYDFLDTGVKYFRDAARSRIATFRDEGHDVSIDGEDEDEDEEESI